MSYMSKCLKFKSSLGGEIRGDFLFCVSLQFQEKKFNDKKYVKNKKIKINMYTYYIYIMLYIYMREKERER